MSNLFGKFIDAVIGEFGSSVAKLTIDQINALIFDSGAKEEKMTQIIQSYPSNMVKVKMIFSLKSKIPEKTIYLESAVSLTPFLALQIKNTVAPNFPHTILIVGWGPGKSEKEIMERFCGCFYVKGSSVEVPSVVCLPDD